MRSIEAEGETIDQAIESALRALQVERDRVQVDILGDAVRGLFGLGRRKARIRATVRAPLSATLDAAHDPGDPVPQETAVDLPAVDHPAQNEEHAKGVVETIVAHLGLSCRVQLRRTAEPGVSLLEIAGEDAGRVIGKRGETLDAIEYLVNRIASRSEESGRDRFVLDAEGYRDRRKEYLEDLARRSAGKVRSSGRPATLNAMSPRDRRIVHLTLRVQGDVDSRSLGQGYYRKMLIVPGGRPPRRNPTT